MRKLSNILILILFIGCTEFIPAPQDEVIPIEVCECELETTIISIIFVNGSASTSVSISRAPFGNDCDTDGDIIYQSNTKTQIVDCE